MKNLHKKSLAIAVLAAIAAPFAFAAKRYNDKFLCVYAKEPTDEMTMSDVMKALETKFGEVANHIKKVQDDTVKAIEDVRKEGTVYAKTADDLKANGEVTAKLQDEIAGMKTKFLELEQRGTKKPGTDIGEIKTAGQIVAESKAYTAMLESKEWKMSPVTMERKAIVNATGASQPLVPSDRLAGIMMPGLRRLTIRDLIPSIPTDSNLVEFCRELVFTNNAGPQGGTTSPTVAGGEGEAKRESAITFELANAAVITIAHFIAASRQVLKDAKQLRGYIDTRLEYGLKLEEENELLNSAGTSGELNGLRNQQTAFAYSQTNQTDLDTILRAFLQVSLSYYEASAVILHPTDWASIMLSKDTTGRYLFSDPHSMEAPRVWGKTVLATPTMPANAFQCGAYDMAAGIYDNEQVSIRMSDQHADFFTRNLVAILCEERLALAMYRAAAIVGGTLTHGQ